MYKFMAGLLVKEIIFSVLLVLTYSETYFVTPSTNTPCPEEGVPCFTLSQYANKPNDYFQISFNTTLRLVLLPGNHSFDVELSFRNISFLSVESWPTTSHSVSDTSINICYQSARFNFESIDIVSMRGLVLFGCMNNEVTRVEQFTLDNCSFDGQGRNGTGLQVNEVSTANITRSSFSSNTGREISLHLQQRTKVGGAIIVFDSNRGLGITIFNSTIQSNSVNGNSLGFGGALYAESSLISIVNSTLNSNMAFGQGGAVYAVVTSITIVNSTLNNNTATGHYGDGGAVYALNSNPRPITITIDNSVLRNNSCTGKGSVFHFISVVFNSSGFLDVQNNKMASNSLYAVQSTLYFLGNTTVSNNYGSLLVYSCNVTFMGYTNIVNNSYYTESSEILVGGTFTARQSEIVFLGTVNLMYNSAIRGGAIAATQTKVYIYGDLTVSHNTASESGGGIYAYQSELNFMKNAIISRNSAIFSGGGIHAISSTMRLTDGSNTNINDNHAERGGGICLEGSANLYLLKRKEECLTANDYICVPNISLWTTLQLQYNTADYGGAMYVADDTYPAICSATPFGEFDETTECFMQELKLYEYVIGNSNYTNILNTYFTDNSARVAGDVLYGGLLDRCTVNPTSEIFYKYGSPSSLSAMSYILNITDLEAQNWNSTKIISSDPVRVCFCRNNQPDCSYHPQPKEVRKGETFTVSFVAVDHINNPIAIANIKIHASVSLEAKLGEGQSIQQTSGDGSCTNLVYSILSENNSEKLHLYADGPCMNAGISTASLTVNFAPCPIGFIDNDLRCDCDPILSSEYISDCSIVSETVWRKDNVWFSYVNTTHHKGYILHNYCPFDYCHPPTEDITVNLNIENGANVLCAFNRSGKLCGSCDGGFSLCLGSSRCTSCSNKWLALLFVFAAVGVALVAFILMLNFTVAVGTISSIIFYANIFAANRAKFFPHDETKILSVFIAWLNLDLGFETCFYDGMDGYVKTWLDFAFPLYIISLVVAIIIISDYSTKFARLFTGKNPIATLATLILLSYTKLLRTIFAMITFTNLQYSDGTVTFEHVWKVDANIRYLSGKHIPLFIAALVVATVGLAYTFILFSWQWLVYCPNRGPLRWIIGNTKVIAFMDAYHNPYNKEHRYWIGLLLFVRVVLYVAFSTVLGDPTANMNLLSVALILAILVGVIIALFALQQFAKQHQGSSNKHKLIYCDRLNNLLETLSILNLACLAILAFFIKDKDSQNVVAYISTSIAFITFVIILVYHSYKYVFKRVLIARIYMPRLLRTQHQILGNRASLTMTDEESVSETEVNALPAPMDTISETEEEQFVTTDSEEDDIESAKMLKSGPNTHTNLSVPSQTYKDDFNQPPTLESIPDDESHSKPLNDRTHHLKTSCSSLITRSPPTSIPASCNPLIRIQSHNLVHVLSGHKSSTVHSSVLAETSPLEPDDYESEDERTPLIGTS